MLRCTFTGFTMERMSILKYKVYKDLTLEEAGVIEASLNFFITYDFVGVSETQKQANNVIAAAAKQRVKDLQITYSADEIRIMGLAVSLFVKHKHIAESSLDFDSYAALANNVLNKLRVLILENTMDGDDL